MDASQTDLPAPVPDAERDALTDATPRPRVGMRLLIGIGLIVLAAVGTVVLMRGLGSGVIAAVRDITVRQVAVSFIFREFDDAPIVSLMEMQGIDFKDEAALGAYFDRQVATPSGFAKEIALLGDSIDLDGYFREQEGGSGWRLLSSDRQAVVKDWCRKAAVAHFLQEMVKEPRREILEAAKASAEEALSVKARYAFFEALQRLERELSEAVEFAEIGEEDGDVVVVGTPPSDEVFESVMTRNRPKLIQVMTTYRTQLSPDDQPEVRAEMVIEKRRMRRNDPDRVKAEELRMRLRKIDGVWRITMGWANGKWVRPSPRYLPGNARRIVEELLDTIGEDGTSSNVERTWTSYLLSMNELLRNSRAEFIERAMRVDDLLDGCAGNQKM